MDVEALPPAWRGTPFIFYSSPGTLTSLACSKVALICWSYEIRHLYPDEIRLLDTDDEERFINRKFSCVDVYKTSLPSSIVKKIDKDIKIIGMRLKKWTDDLNEIFNVNVHDVISRCIDHIVVESNGTISYKKTARSLLDGDAMNPYEKYTIACKYCFESDVQRLWPLVSDDPFRCTLNCIGPWNGMIHYWNGQMNNEPHHDVFDLMEEYPSQAWTIIEYFWNRLHPSMQSSLLDCASFYESSDAIKYLLPILSTNQLANFLRRYSNEILLTLTNDEESCRYAMQIWDYLLSNGEVTKGLFFSMLENLCSFLESYVEKHNINHPTPATSRTLLHYIWNTVPDNLKNSISSDDILSIFNILFASPSETLFETYGFNMDFFLDLLTRLEFQQRNELWLQDWRSFVVFAAASDLKKIMELCLPNDDIAEFKNQMVNCETLKSEFYLFIANGRCLELENYLKLFCSSEAEEKLVRIQIVDLFLSRMFQLDFETLKKFNGLINSTFSSPSSANQRKEEYFRENINKAYALLNQGLVGNVENIAKFLISHNPEYLAEIKQVLLVRCRNNLISGSVINFNIRYWQEFIKWCAPTGEDFVEFKNSLPLDDIFVVWLTKIVIRDGILNRLHWFGSFTPLSNFLRWYFDDGDAVKKFLLEKIANYEQVDAIRNAIQEKKTDLLCEMLMWFFNGNKEQVKEFHVRAGLQVPVEVDDEVDVC